MTALTSIPATRTESRTGWRRSLAEAIRDPAVLVAALGLDPDLAERAKPGADSFPLVVPHSYLARMQPGDADDPLLRQVLPVGEELDEVPGFSTDAVDDAASREAPGLLHKYTGRALLVTTGACAVHCRYCFRRHYPYGEEPKSLADWEPAFDTIAADDTLHEVILSGGDPLVLVDERLQAFAERIAAIPHIRRLRIHTRLPIVLPDRVTEALLEALTGLRPTPIVVVHANHANELVDDCAEAVRRLVRGGLTTLNQAVLLRGVNDTVAAQAELCERLVDLGVVPYYLHQLDRVAGAAHFEVSEAEGRRIVAALRERLPGYAIPRFVREVAGQPFKVPLT